MKKTIIALLIYLLAYDVLSAQWQQLNGPGGGSVHDLVVKENIAYAATNGGVFRTDDGLNTWELKNNGIVTTYISCIDVMNGNIYAGTGGKGLYKSIDDGESWFKIFGADYDPTGGIQTIAHSENKIFISTGYGTFFSDNEGLTWNFIGSWYFNGFAAQGELLLAGGSGYFHRSTNNGVDWDAPVNGLPSGNSQTIKIIGSSIYIGYQPNYLEYGIYKSIDGGENWSIIGGNTFLNLAVYEIKEVNGVIFAGTNAGVYSSTDDGNNWLPTNSGLSLQSYAQINDIEVLGNNIFVAKYDGIFKTDMNPINWIESDDGLTALEISKVGFNQGTIFAATYGGGLRKSADCGNSWERINQINSDFPKNITISEGIIFIGTADKGIYKSTNNGISWTFANNGLSSPTIETIYQTGQQVFCSTPNGTYRSTNNGATWLKIHDMNSNAIVSKNGVIYIGNNSSIYKSFNQGQTWTNCTGNLSNPYVYVLMADDEKVYMGSNYGVFTYDEDLNEWNSTNNPHGAITELVLLPNSIMATSNYGVSIYHKLTKKWTIIHDGLINASIKSACVGGDNIYIGTQYTSLWKSQVTDYLEMILVDLPNGGEEWKVGTNKTISWTSKFIDSVKIEYTTNNGVNWQIINSAIDATIGTYNWSIPNTVSTNCKVRVSDLTGTIIDESDNTFTIYTPSLILNSPNGGENWQAGTNQNITWTSNYINNVKLDYSTNNGSNWINIIQSVPASNGSYLWNIPNVSSSNCKVKVTSLENILLNDVSDNNFTIFSPTLNITAPISGTLTAGQNTNITWTSSNISNVKIEFTTNNGTDWVTVIASTPSNTGSYSWLIPNVASTTCKVKLTAVENGSITSTGGTFSIVLPTNPTIAVTSPNGGENWKVGEKKDIKWTSTDVTNVKLEYTTNGTDWNEIIASTQASTGKYEWTIPNTPAINCKVRISDVSNNTINDLSDNVFIIEVPAEQIVVKSPNGGEIYKVGSVHNITWEASGITNVKIEYTTNSGTTWSPIVASTPANTGSYSWVVPNTVSSLCKVKITGVENNTPVDISDYNFSIHATIDLDMLVVKGGTFAMGSAAGSNDETPIHNVTLSSFQMGKYEVTQKLWQQIMGNNPSTHVGDNLPVAGVSWNVAQNFITALNNLTGRYFRLPTEAEWEFAARGGVSSGGFTYSGSNTPGDIGWYNGNSSQVPHEVGTKLPNEIGLCDMSGNVTEWCNDWYDANYYGASPSSNPQGPSSGTFRVIRGGYWESDGDGVRVANRSQYLPNSASNYYGLRLAEDLFTLIVTAPNGDENWQVGTTQNITWKSSNIDNVKIQYSTNAGSTWLDVVASVPAVSGSYSWLVPNTPSGYCKVRVSSVETVSLNDISDNVFTIKSAVTSTVNLTSPNGGESWLAGTNQNITWTSSNINNLKIEYSTNNGTNWSTVVASVAAANGIYQWVVPNTPSINCRIRLSDALNSATNDVSDNPFSIIVPSITVNAPNGGENWQAGTQQNITWVSNNVTNVKIEYSTNNGTNWTTVNSSIAATLGTYTWTVPTVNSTNCKVKISDVSNSAVNDISNNVFSIYTQVLGTITVSTPNGGENWEVSTSQNITWVSSNITNVKIEYSSNAGTNWTTINSSVSAALGTYSWQIPSSVSTNCLVKISDVTNSSISDVSNNVFTISTPSSGTITIDSPNGGESWKAGDTKDIKWVSTNITNVKIEYTTNNGANWTQIIASTSASTGKYEWTVPNTPSTNCRVHVSDVSNYNIYDISDAVFTIEAQAVTKTLVLTKPTGGEEYLANSTQQINWTSSNVSDIKIEFSTNNGTNWTELEATVPASQNNTTWVAWNLNSSTCKIRITDKSDNSVTSQNSNNFTIFTYSPQITINKSITFGDVNTPSSCRIIGIPGNINSSVSQFVSGTHKTDWNAYRDNGASSSYYQQYDGTDAFNFKPGRAFWVISRNGLNVNTNINNVTIDSENSYTIQLQAGWNLISSPFDRTVQWSQVIQKNNITLNPLLYGYPNTYTGNQTVMAPYEGYYFYNAHNLSGLKIPYNPNGVSSLQLFKGSTLFADNNVVNIKLISENEKASEIFISIDDSSSVDFDSNDYFAAPGGFEESSIKLINNNLSTSYKYLLKDTRPFTSNGLTYEFIIKAMSNKNNELVWGEIPAKYNDYEVYLIDNRINKLYDMKKIESLSIPKHYNENKYSLLIGNSDYINSVKESLTPNEFTLEQNYPNPFNPSTVIRFSTPYTSNVNISLYNVLGELVNVVIDEVKDAGTHEVTCNMQGLSAGVYFYRLDAKSIDGNKNFSNVKKMVLLK